MNFSSHKEYIQDLVINGKIKLAIRELINGTRNHQPQLNKKVVHLSARNSENDNKKNLGRIDERDYGVIKANIIYTLNENLEEYVPNSEFEFPSTDVESNNPTPDVKSKKKIFLTYNHKDKEWADNIHSMLVDNEIEVIIDTISTRPGQGLEEFSRDSVVNSDFTISLISENSLFSTWVMLENQEALRFERYEGRAKFLPVVNDKKVLENEFVRSVQRKSRADVEKIKKMMLEDLEEDFDFEDLFKQKKQLENLERNISSFMSYLRSHKFIDVSGGNFYNGIKELIKHING